jgi:uncharacterized protein YebE (UPF0316 family)
VILFSSSPAAPDLQLPLLIFVAEIVVVTLSTIRIIFVSRGMKGLAALMGFFEVSIWLYAIGQIMQNLSDLRCYAAFAGGFTIGNYLGVLIHDKLALGQMVVRLVTGKGTAELTEGLKGIGYGVTRVDGQGARGPVQMVLTVIQRRDLGRVIDVIKRFDDKAFYSIDELYSTAAGIFPAAGVRPGRLVQALRHWRSRPGKEIVPADAAVLACPEAVT